MQCHSILPPATKKTPSRLSSSYLRTKFCQIQAASLLSRVGGWVGVVIIKLKANLSSNWTGLGLDWSWAWQYFQHAGTELRNSYVKSKPSLISIIKSSISLQSIYIYICLSQSILGLSQVIPGYTFSFYLRQYQAMSHYLWLYMVISGFIWQSLAFYDYLLLSMPIFGYLCLYLVISGFLLLSRGISIKYQPSGIEAGEIKLL